MKRVGIALAALLLLSGCGAHDSQSSASASPQGNDGAALAGGTFLTVAIPAPVSELPLVDAAGQEFSLASLHGKYVVIANFMTSCQDICPMTTANMRRIGDAVHAAALDDTIAVVEISIDAQRDTPSRMAAYQALYGRDHSWTLASGTTADLQAMWTFFGAPAERRAISAKDAAAAPQDWQTGRPVTYDMSHADLVLIIGPDGTWRWLDLGAPKTADGKIPAALKAFLTEDGKAALAKPEEPTWTADAVLSALSTLTGKQIKA
jgi:cytochrome oxidase Cu insertion factor (SCO1/SenC/PrrC family)